MFKRKSPKKTEQALPTERYHRQRFGVRVGVVSSFVLVLCAVLIGRFYWLQIKQYDHFIAQSKSNSSTFLPIAPVRGDIVDTNGVVLARNYPAFSLELSPEQLDRPMDEVVAALQEYVTLRPSDMRQFNKFRREYRGLGNIPLKMQLSPDEAQKLAGELFRFQGVEINARTFREYPHGELTAHFIGYNGASASYVYPHAEQCVDKAYAISSRCFTGLCNIGNAGNVGAQLHVYGLICHRLYCCGNLCSCIWTGTECHTARMYVGAAYVDLDDLHLVLFVYPLTAVFVFVYRKTADIGYYGLAEYLP